MNDQPRALFVPAHEDPLRALAQRICAEHAASLPDLSHVHVVIPDSPITPALRRELLRAAGEHGHAALLAPRVETLRTLAARQCQTQRREVGGYERELLLAEALANHPRLYGNANPWLLAENLLRLFDDLTLHTSTLPNRLEDFERQLARAYGVLDAAPPALSREATLVHTLWHAWHAQLRALRMTDEQAGYVARLAATRAVFADGARLYVACFSSLAPAEWSWLLDVTRDCGAIPVLHGVDAANLPEHFQPLRHYAESGEAPKTASPARVQLLDAVFGQDTTPLHQRAAEFARRHPLSPAAESLSLYAAHSNEDEARAIDVQVRRWIIAGHTNIGIVTEDRRLARRVRALLERADVVVDDHGGWALSTTSAATVLERWLQCVEEDFAYGPLLDVLKSPMVFTGDDRAEHLRCVYRLEEDIIRNGNVPRGIDRYRNHLRLRRERLPGDMGARYPPVERLLDRIQFAANSVLEMLGARIRSPSDFLEAVHISVERLDLIKSWSQDAAGACILGELDQLREAARRTQARMRWIDFRAWLGRALEHATFIPPNTGHAVRVLTFAQTAGMTFDAVIVAACDHDHLPGPGASSPFFNASVRAELGLPTEDGRHAMRRFEFQRVLLSAPRVVLTRVQHRGGEIVIPSPWWDLLRTFHVLAYGTDLADDMLAALARNPATEVLRGDDTPAPEPTQQPRAKIDPRLVPKSYSADSYDRLIACPYQFFAANSLKLKPPETIREALRKDDYGRRVHRCLEALFRTVAGLPEPFPEKISADNRTQAIAHLERISRAVFRRDLEDNFQHRAWLKQWLRTIPSFVDWEIEHSADWNFDDAELRADLMLEDSDIRITGRLDRVDLGANGNRIIDYKTGKPPRLDAVEAGESIQLCFYVALLGKRGRNSACAEYVRIDDERVASTVRVESPELQRLADESIARLRVLNNQLMSGQPAPAWGDAETCARCSMDGLCRRAYWENNSEERADARDN